MLRIRPAIPEDKQSIRQIYQLAVGSSFTLDEALYDRLLASGGLLVAEVDLTTIGFGGIDLSAEEQLKWLYLTPAHQGQGLGSSLLENLESIGWQAGLTTLRLHAAPEAVQFYLKHGYHPAEEEHGSHHDHEGVEMVKERRA